MRDYLLNTAPRTKYNGLPAKLLIQKLNLNGYHLNRIAATSNLSKLPNLSSCSSLLFHANDAP